jgi:hypothetical protein
MFVFLNKGLEMKREDLARAVFVAMAEGTNPTREVPTPLLEKSARLSFRAADAFLRVSAEEAEKAEKGEGGGK